MQPDRGVVYKEITVEQADSLWEAGVVIQFKAEGAFDWTDFPYYGEWSPSRDAASARTSFWQGKTRSRHHRVRVE